LTEQEFALPVRFARWALSCAVRHWPEETRAWGVALAAEIDETRSDWESLRWSLGGLMLFARSLVTSLWGWMQLPAGGSLAGNDGPKGPTILPKRSRLTTVAILAATAVVLCVPQSREAISAVLSSWWSFGESPFDRVALDRLTRRAEKDKDGATLAFVALRSEQPQQFLALADRAVALDPRLVWVYAAVRNYSPVASPDERLERVRNSDPDNAMPLLLTADRFAEDQGSSDQQTFEAKLASNPRWMALMERALRAPRYDSYIQRHALITSAVWSRHPTLSPSAALRGLWAHAIPDLLNVKTFADIKLHAAEKAHAAGDFPGAVALASEVDSFGKRMQNGSGTDIEKLMGVMLERNANNELSQLYTSAGRTAESQRAAQRVEQIQADSAKKPYWANPETMARMGSFRSWGLVVQAAASLALMAAFAGLAALLSLEFWPARMSSRALWWRRAACWAADYTPAILFTASGAFLVSFLPYARALSDFRSSNNPLANERELSGALLALGAVPDRVLGNDGSVSFWSFAIVALAALAVFIVVRGVYRTKGVRTERI